MPGPLNRAVSRILAAHAEESSATQREIARRAGIGQATVSRLLGCQSPMTFDQFEALCGALRLDTTDVLSEASR